MTVTQGIPTSKSSTFTVDPVTGVAIFTPYVWDENTQEYKAQRVLPDIHADGGQLVHVTNPSGGGGGGDATEATLQSILTKLSDILVELNQKIEPGGAVSVNNFPAAFGVSGNVEVVNDVGNPLPVSGSVSVSNFPGSQPVTGPLTDTQLRASAVPVSLASVPSHAVTGPLTDAQLRAAAVPVAIQAADLAALETIQIGSLPAVALDAGTLAALETISVANFPATQPVSGTVEITNDVGNPIPVSFAAGAAPTFKGRCNTFRTPGRAGTGGQNLMSIFNTGTKVIRLKTLALDVFMTVVKAVTVAPPIIRAYRLTVAPTNGTALTKVAEDTALASDAGVTILGDASADGVGSAVTLTSVPGAGTLLTQEPAPRLITAAGYEMFDRTIFFDTSEVVVRQNQGVLLRLDYVLATQNPVTDMWLGTLIWTEE